MATLGSPVFRCYLLNRIGRIEKRVDLVAGTEEMAREEAMGVLGASTFTNAELWFRDQLVASLRT